MYIKQLQYFISVAQTLNFSEAGRRSGLTQPAISHHINELEKELNCQLFVRSKRSVVITESGRQFLPYAIEMTKLAEKAAFQLQQVEDGYDGRVSIASFPTNSEALFNCLAAFSHKYPNISVDVSFVNGREQILALNEGSHDAYFAVEDMVPSADQYDMRVTNIGYLSLLLPSNHPMAKKPIEEIDFKSLEKERFVALSESVSPGMYHTMMRTCNRYGFTPNISWTYDQAEVIAVAVGTGLGISILPAAVGKVAYTKNVSFLSLNCDESRRVDVVAWRRQTSNPAALRFIEVAKAIFPDKNIKLSL